MISLLDLQNASKDNGTLQTYIDEHFPEIYDFFTSKTHSELVELRVSIDSYIKLHRISILNLESSSKKSLAFITLLIDVCEQLGLIASFGFLYDHLLKLKFNIGQRLNAAALYLKNIRTGQDYLHIFDSICEKLQISIETESDSPDKVLLTFVNYYAQVIIDFGEFNSIIPITLRDRIRTKRLNASTPFLDSALISEVLEVDFSNFELAYESIHKLLDKFLGRERVKLIPHVEQLLESDTEYSNKLINATTNFPAIKQISANIYQEIRSDSIFYSLGRGVVILAEENQLYAYMYSYGDMHYAKLMSAFPSLQAVLFDNPHEVYDWGCGQGIASMSYFDYINGLDTTCTIARTTLIEPSSLALKRAALHIQKYDNGIIRTINKKLDDLTDFDFSSSESNFKVHLFSNILDINDFSLVDLMNIISHNFPGTNYFVCVSPYVDDTRTSRLDAFVDYFSTLTGFELLKSIDNRSGTWINGWSRVIRIFKVEL